MTTIENTRYPQNITQNTTDSNKKQCQPFVDTSNLKAEYNPAVCSIPANGQAKDKPAILIFKDFDFSIPAGAKDITVNIYYTSYLAGTSVCQTTAYPSIHSPLIKILNADTEQKSNVTPVVEEEHTVKFTNLSQTVINSDDFGFSIEFPENKGAYGLLQIRNVYITVSYTSPSFVVSANRITTNKISVGDGFHIQFNLHDLNNSKIKNTSCNIVVPEELQYNEITSGSGKITNETIDSTTILEWNTSFTNDKSTITLKFTAKKIGNPIITIQDASENTYHLKIPIVTETVDTTNTLYEHMVEDVTYNYTVTAISSNKTKNPTFAITLPDCAEIINTTTLANTYNANVTSEESKKRIIITWKATLNPDNGTQILPIQVVFHSAGIYTQTIYYQDKVNDTSQFHVRSKEYQNISYTKLEASEKVYDRIDDGATYTALSLLKLETTGTTEILDTDHHTYRFGVFNSSRKLIANDDDFIDACVWSKTVAGTKTTMQTVEFTYDSNYPVVFVWTNTYMEADVFGSVNVIFSEPQLIESGAFYHNPQKEGLFPYKLKSLIEDTDFGSVDIPALSKTNRMRLYRFEKAGLDNIENLVVEGIAINFDYNCDDEVEALLNIRVGHEKTQPIDVKVGQTNRTLYKGSGSVSIGGSYELFGLRPNDFTDQVGTTQLELVLLNPYHNDVHVELSNVTFTLYYMQVPHSLYSFTVDDEPCENYGIFVNDVVMGGGTVNDVKYYQTSGTDNNTAYRSNINKKEIEIDYTIYDCNFAYASILFEKSAKYLSNLRNEFNKPYLKRIEFNHIPEFYYMFVREAEITKTNKIAGYLECKAKLVIPAGTGYTKTVKVTGSTGTNNGVTRVTPSVFVVASQDKAITVTETISGQSMILKGSTIKTGDLISINSTDRIIKLTRYQTNKTTIVADITNEVDYSSSWFSLNEKYVFSGNNTCIIQRVEYRERS